MREGTMDFPAGTAIHVTGRDTCVATPYPDKGHVHITIVPVDGDPVTVQLRGWEARAVARTLELVSKGIE